jgi:hypothetical protein
VFRLEVLVLFIRLAPLLHHTFRRPAGHGRVTWWFTRCKLHRFADTTLTIGASWSGGPHETQRNGVSSLYNVSCEEWRSASVYIITWFSEMASHFLLKKYNFTVMDECICCILPRATVVSRCIYWKYRTVLLKWTKRCLIAVSSI